MKYIEYKNLCQGKRYKYNIRRFGCVSVILISVFIWAIIVMALFGCGSSKYGYRSRVMDTPIHLIAEIPGEELPVPFTIESKKKPKGIKSYFLPEYKRETEFRKWK